MDLADRGRRERLVAERPEDRLGIVPELLADDRADLVVRERRDLVQQLEQLVAIRRRQQVEAQREHLAELDPGAAQPLERHAHPDRPAAAVGTRQVERRRHEEQEEDDEDVPDPARVPEQRSHVASTRSAATGRRPVRSRDSSATRGPGAELEPSGTLVIHRDAAAAGREGGLLLPLATGPDELGERSPRVAIEECHRALGGQLGLASVAHAHPDGVRDPRLALVEGRREPAMLEVLARIRHALRRTGRSARPRAAGARAPPRRRSRPASARAPWIPLRRPRRRPCPSCQSCRHPRSLCRECRIRRTASVPLRTRRRVTPSTAVDPGYSPDRSNQVVLSWV